jgi:hypothetical protein
MRTARADCPGASLALLSVSVRQQAPCFRGAVTMSASRRHYPRVEIQAAKYNNNHKIKLG